MELSSEQTEALNAFKDGDNIFITGPGGTGKSELIRHLVTEAQSKQRAVQVCALTGCAAVLLQCEGAKTIHSWGGVGLANGDFQAIIDRVSKNKHKRAAWMNVDVLIIDEVSMMSARLFNLLDRIGRRTRRRLDVPFGGIQLVFSGDFYQLPPVGDETDNETTAFCFESINWNTTFDKVIQLTTMFRQTDPRYAKVLNQIRIGKISKNGMKLLEQRVGAECDNEFVKPTILLPRRRDADIINKKQLALLETEEKIYDMSLFRDTKENISEEHYEKETKYLSSNVMADQRLVLKVGAQVMCVANVDMEGATPLVNGSQGVVVEFEGNIPIVQFRNGTRRKVDPHLWESENVKGVGVKQIPLIHAWAITIHKSQGVTLELAQIDAGSSIFECGQTYVALSRVKASDGLYLTAFDIKKIKINRKVQEYYCGL